MYPSEPEEGWSGEGKKNEISRMSFNSGRTKTYGAGRLYASVRLVVNEFWDEPPLLLRVMLQAVENLA
jgi:hypothetical protein